MPEWEKPALLPVRRGCEEIPHGLGVIQTAMSEPLSGDDKTGSSGPGAPACTDSSVEMKSIYCHFSHKRAFFVQNRLDRPFELIFDMLLSEK